MVLVIIGVLSFVTARWLNLQTIGPGVENFEGLEGLHLGSHATAICSAVVLSIPLV